MSDQVLHCQLAEVEATINALCSDDAISLSNIVRDHFGSGGSRVRARLALQSGQSLNLPQDVCISLAAGCELLHNASLIHDDLQDRDMVRRDAPTVWAAHGENTAICAGDLMLSAAYAAFAQTGTKASDVIMHAHHRVAQVICGQCDDLRLGGSCADPETYEQIAAAKSGPLLALPLELALIVAGRKDLVNAAKRAATMFAIAYQILDDLTDVTRDSEKGSMNAVNVYALSGSKNPRESACNLAIDRLDLFEQFVSELPAGMIQALVQRAEPIRNALTRQLEAA
jgi:geranylgeranyl diphosphate synthase type II